MAVKIHQRDGRVRDVALDKPHTPAGASNDRVRQSATGETVRRLKDALDRSDAASHNYRTLKSRKAVA